MEQTSAAAQPPAPAAPAASPAPHPTPATPKPAPPPQPVYSIAEIRAQQNFGLAVAAGLGAALAGAAAWAIVTVITEMELGLMAIAVGYIVGQAIKNTGKGLDQQFGILGAVCSLIGCVLGNLFSVVVFYAKGKNIGIGEAFGELTPDFAIQLMSITFEPLDLLFYAIAVYQGYKLSFKYRAL
jgi:hypothetical protein